MRGLRVKTGREGEGNPKAALEFAREDANGRRRRRSKPGAPTRAKAKVKNAGWQPALRRPLLLRGRKAGGALHHDPPLQRLVIGRTKRPVFFLALRY